MRLQQEAFRPWKWELLHTHGTLMVLTTLSEVAWIPVWNTSHAFYILTSPRVSINYGPWLHILVNVFRIRKWMIGSQSTTSSGDNTSDSLLPSISTLLDWDPLQVHIPYKSVRLLLASVCVFLGYSLWHSRLQSLVISQPYTLQSLIWSLIPRVPSLSLPFSIALVGSGPKGNVI